MFFKKKPKQEFIYKDLDDYYAPIIVTKTGRSSSLYSKTLLEVTTPSGNTRWVEAKNLHEIHNEL